MLFMSVGYARVSTLDQNLELQIDALKNAGCERIFTEKISGKSKDDRPELNNMFSKLREGDTVIVWKLDRLGRSLTNLIDLISELNKHGVHFLHPLVNFAYTHDIEILKPSSEFYRRKDYKENLICNSIAFLSYC